MTKNKKPSLFKVNTTERFNNLENYKYRNDVKYICTFLQRKGGKNVF